MKSVGKKVMGIKWVKLEITGGINKGTSLLL